MSIFIFIGINYVSTYLGCLCLCISCLRFDQYGLSNLNFHLKLNQENQIVKLFLLCRGFTCFLLVCNTIYLLLFTFRDNLVTFSHSLTFTNSVLSVLSAVRVWVFIIAISKVVDNVVSYVYI